MPRYRNLSRHSGVVAYETTDDAITLTFVNGERYAYSTRRPGRAVVEHMKTLAQAGRDVPVRVGASELAVVVVAHLLRHVGAEPAARLRE